MPKKPSGDTYSLSFCATIAQCVYNCVDDGYESMRLTRAQNKMDPVRL